MTRIVLLIAAMLAVLCCQASPGRAQAYGNAPWCAVIDQGGGDVVWQCEYQTAAQCAPNVIAGNRGFCNINPTYIPPQGVPRRWHSHQ